MSAVIQNEYTGNNSTTQYPFTFPYLKTSDIKASLDGVETTAFTLPNATTLQFNTAPGSGVKIKIFRETSVDNLTATFYAGSAIKSEDLNDNFTQNLYKTQEVGARALNTLGGTMTGNLTLDTQADLVFEGATADAHETTIKVVDPTADRTITFPNVTGTVVTTGDTGTVARGMIAADAVNGTKIADDSIDSEHYIDGSIDTAHIANSAVTGGKIASNAVDSVHYTDASIDTRHIADSQVTTAKLATNSVTNAKIVDLDITASKIATNTVNSRILADASVGTGHLADNIVTQAKMADDSVGAAELVDASVGEVALAANSVTNAKMADSAVGTSELVNNAVTTDKIADNAVTMAKLAGGTLPSDIAVVSANITDGTIATADIADNAVTTGKIQDGELKTLAGMQSGTASKLASGQTLTADINDLNQIDGLTKQTTISDTDTSFPTSGAVVDYVAAQLAPLGGFEVVANEQSFPNTQPAAGVVISIADAGGLTVSNSGTASGQTVGGTTVNITGIASNFNGTTVAAGIRFLVASTGSGQNYTYHKATLKEDDLINLSGDINDFSERYRVGSSNPTSSLDNGDLFFNTSTGKLLVYNGTNSAWEEAQSIGNFFISTLSPAFDGSTQNFTITNAPTNAQQIILSINGVVQKPNAGTNTPSEGFALTGSTVKLSAAPAAGDSYHAVVMGSTVNIGTPSNNTVSTAIIQNGAVTTGKIADDAVTTAKIADSQVVATTLASNAVTTPKILDANVTTDKIADGAVQTAKLAANAVQTSQITDANVTTAKIADNAVTTAKIAADAIDGTKLADNAVNSEHYTDGSIGTIHLGADIINTSKIADDAVTAAKIANNNIGAQHIANGEVGTTELADQAVTLAKLEHGTSSNDGKFLRANNGADPTFETVTGTTINNNADNRVITGSGTANTLEGESALTFDGSQNLKIGSTSYTAHSAADNLVVGGTGSDGITILTSDTGTANLFLDSVNGDRAKLQYAHNENKMHIGTTGGTALSIDGSKNVGVGTTSPSARLHIDSSHYVTTSSGKSTTGVHIDGNPGNAGEYGGGISFGCGNSSGSSAAIAARQGTSDSDVIGMSFFTHDSSAGTADAVEKVRIHDGGSVSFNNGIILGNGLGYNSSNLMDDYEEGTWTPNPHGYWSGAWRQATVVGGQITGATYTKIGRLVYFKCYFSNVTLNSNALGTYARIDGLPFTCANDSYGSNTTSAHSNAFGNTDAGSFYIAPNNSYMLGTRYGSNSYDYSTWKSGNFYLMLAGTYQATA